MAIIEECVPFCGSRERGDALALLFQIAEKLLESNAMCSYVNCEVVEARLRIQAKFLFALDMLRDCGRDHMTLRPADEVSIATAVYCNALNVEELQSMLVAEFLHWFYGQVRHVLMIDGVVLETPHQLERRRRLDYEHAGIF